MLIYETDKINEYFIVENRSQIDLDAAIPSSGLAVYHCDTMGSNEWQGGTATRHYQCGLLQADGRLDLETNQSMGDERDLFGRVEGIALCHSTRPCSALWDGSDSGLIISNISAPGKVITFTVGQERVEHIIKKASSPGSGIPDNNALGLRDVISIDQEGSVTRLRVEVDISHSNIANLRVDLISPRGRKAVLHNRTGLGRKSLVRTYDSQSSAALTALLGSPLRGRWVLRIRDLVSGDEGRLNSWGLEIAY
ncbi:MAG: proprotein convertase P-domain-containing protein [Methanothrix sp.]|nr:proprotein convertase P-domain-containing protein [Methanothrix sp.]